MRLNNSHYLSTRPPAILFGISANNCSKNPDMGELWFLHDGLNILMDQATDGTPWASYNQGIGIDNLVSVDEYFLLS